MRLSLTGQIPLSYRPEQFVYIFKQIENQANALAEGRLAGRHFTATVAPTTGDFAVGDMVWDSAPAEAGGAGSKYVRLGWICTAAGSPGTFKEMRVLTGN